MGGLSGVTDTESTALFIIPEIPFPVFPEYQRKHIKCVAAQQQHMC